jgi:penicillin-binding protein 1B
VEGAHAALPVWLEFMQRAHEHRAYRDVTTFAIPAGVVSAQIDPSSGGLATSACPKIETEYYLAGTQPVQYCPLHQGSATQIAGWEPGVPLANGVSSSIPIQPAAAKPPPFPSYPNTAVPAGTNPQTTEPQPQPEQRKKKSGFFDKFKNIFK